MTKKLTLLFFICILSALSINAEVYEGSCGTNVRYSLDTSTGVLSITGTGVMSYYSQYSDRPWDSLTSYIKMIQIADGVTSIGEIAFSQCSSLTSVTIPNSVTSIGDGAFFYCSSLKSIAIPNSVTSMGSEVFYNCSSLSFVTIGNSVRSIGRLAFHGCSSLKSVTIGNSVTSIGYEAFKDCSNLASVIIPHSVTSIGQAAFSKCSKLTSVTIGNNVTSIGYQAFKDCSNLASVIIGSGVKSIESYAFSSKPTKVIWLTNTPPENYSRASGVINYVANNNYTSLSNKTVYPFLSSMFVVDGIRYVPVSPSERTCDAIDCVYNESAEKINIGEIVTNKGISLTVKQVRPYTCYGNTFIKDVNLSFTGHIGDYAFSGCTSLDSAIISNQGDIGNNAFNGCSRLKTATISNQGNIGEKAFYGCATSGDATFIIENKGYIGTSAFEGCTGITSATISNQGNIGEKAFYGCATKNPATFVINNKGIISNSAFYGCSQMKTAELGEEIPSIGSSAFYGCSKLSDIIIPDAVTSIGTYSFSNCSSLNFAKIGSGIKAILSNTFSGCSSLKDVQIGKNVTSIGEYAFNGCSTLPKIQIPQSVNSIANYVFKGCTRLKTVIMDNGDSDLSLSSNDSNPMFADCLLDSVYIGRNITYNTSSSYGYSPFYRNTSLRTVVITDKETEISENEFYGCTNLQSFKVGDGVTKFGNYAFSGCSSLKSLSFGTQLQSIGQEAFSDCTAITSIVSKVTTPPVCGSQALDDISKWDCVLYVPEGTISTYQAADQWKEFFFIEEGYPFAVLRGDANSDGKVDMDDAIFVTNIILGTEEATEAADVNKDGEINMSDVMFIINYIKSGEFPKVSNIESNDSINYNIIFEDSTYGNARNNCTPTAESGWEIWLASAMRNPDTNYNFNGVRIFNDLALKGLNVGFYCSEQWPDGYIIYGNAKNVSAPTLILSSGVIDFTYHAANWNDDATNCYIYFQVLDADDNVVAQNITQTSEISMKGNRQSSYEADKFTFKWFCPKGGQYKIKFGSPGRIFIGNISIVQKISIES